MSNQFQSLESILALHEHGVSLMKRHQQPNANFFKSTQEILLKCLRQLKQHCAAITSSVSTSQQQQQQQPQVQLQVIPTPIFLDQEENTTESSTGAVFCQMLTVSIVKAPTTSFVSLEEDTQDANHNVNLVAAVIFFNLALLYHIKSLRGSSAQVRAQCQTKAISFYQFSMSLVVKLTDEYNGSAAHDEIDRALSLLAVVLGNNLLCLWADLFSYDELSTCLEWTQYHAERYSVWYCDQQEEEHQQNKQDKIIDTSFFLTNAMVWQHVSSLASAAA